jgi:hypothetical protein
MVDVLKYLSVLTSALCPLPLPSTQGPSGDQGASGPAGPSGPRVSEMELGHKWALLREGPRHQPGL